VKIKMILFAIFATFGSMQANVGSLSDLGSIAIQQVGVNSDTINVQDKIDDLALRVAVTSKDPDKVKELLAQGANPNTYFVNYGMPALMLAILIKSDPEVIEQLLIYGANPNVQDDFGQTALYFAIANFYNIKIVEVLLAHKADPNIQDEKGRAALHAAACVGNLGVVKSLLAYGADPKLKGPGGYTALSFAAGEGNVSVFLELLKYKLWKKSVPFIADNK
jgi:ankyrin repeat protein